MTSNDNARAYLDYFLDQSGDPDCAVMVEGPWGSGKSFFIDQYFADRLANARKGTPAAKAAIRVSLFGVTDVSEIMSVIFAKAHPWFPEKPARVANALLSKVATHYGVSLDPKENQKLLQDTMINLKKRVLVFDDLERCPLPIVEVMGFINRFVEQDKIKVVVIASEEDIPGDQKEEYKARKEKLIGKTLRVGSEPGAVLDAFTAELKTREARIAIAAHREALLATIAASGRPNFRSLRAILSDFERVVEVADAKLRASGDALGALLLYMVAVGMEYRRNGIDAAGMRTLADDVRMRHFLSEGPSFPARVRARELCERYPRVSWGDPVAPPELLASLFASGELDIAALDRHLLTHPLVVGIAATPAWRAMWGFYDLGQADYAQVRSELVDQLAQRQIVHPGELLHAVGSTLRLRDYGDDLLDGQQAKAFFTAYLGELETTEKLLAVPEVFANGSSGYAGLGYHGQDTREFREIHRLVEDATMRALALRMKRESVDLLERLRRDPDGGETLHQHGLAERKYGGVAVLHNIAVRDMADVLLSDGKLNDSLLAALGERYQGAQHNRALDVERDWVCQLHAELESRLKTLGPPHRALAEHRLEYWFDKVKDWAIPAPASPMPEGDQQLQDHA